MVGRCWSALPDVVFGVLAWTHRCLQGTGLHFRRLAMYTSGGLDCAGGLPQHRYSLRSIKYVLAVLRIPADSCASGSTAGAACHVGCSRSWFPVVVLIAE
jgi:hypothetical protein